MPAKHALPLFTFATDRAIQAATPADVERVRRRVDENAPGGCWLWTGYVDPNGYGIVSIKGVSVRVHRAVYWWLVEVIPHRVEIDHLCANKHCCNPDHLQAVPHKLNVARGNAGKHMAAKTHCPKGHPYAGDNLYVDKVNGNRKCRACQRDRMRKRRLLEAGC
jgi:hypothetical protein